MRESAVIHAVLRIVARVLRPHSRTNREPNTATAQFSTAAGHLTRVGCLRVVPGAVGRSPPHRRSRLPRAPGDICDVQTETHSCRRPTHAAQSMPGIALNLSKGPDPVQRTRAAGSKCPNRRPESRGEDAAEVLDARIVAFLSYAVGSLAFAPHDAIRGTVMPHHRHREDRFRRRESRQRN